MRIGITQRVALHEAYTEWRDVLSHDWVSFFEKVLPGSLLIPIPNMLPNAEDWANALDLDALVLSNGNDWGDSPARDETERLLFNRFAASGRPILGFCRGMQVINKFLGGGIEKNLFDACSEQHVAAEHPVRLISDPFLRLSSSESIDVNSYHDCGVLKKQLSEQCSAFAVASKNIVEGLHHKTLPIVGVQWHPERRSEPDHFDSVLIQKICSHGAFWLR